MQRSRQQIQSRPNSGGFTLLEVVVAFVIFSLAFAAVLQIISGSVRNASRSADFTKAALWAQTKLDVVGIDPPLEEGTTDGEFDDEYRWEMTIVAEQPESESALSADQFPLELYRIDLQVMWGDLPKERVAKFATLRAALPER